jgi:hypothetical protein
MDVISNGKLMSKVPSQTAGYTTFHWLQDKPHVNYLVALAAGYFHRLEATAGALPLAMLVPPSEKDQAANAFQDTAKIIEFFQQEIGVPFAWDKYFQVYCHDFLAGGMENTSCTFEAASMLFTSQTEQLRTLHRLDAHETAHQWFGDLVTCRDWSHLWLNEGFASYYTVLYEGEKSGAEAMNFALWREAEHAPAGPLYVVVAGGDPYRVWDGATQVYRHPRVVGVPLAPGSELPAAAAHAMAAGRVLVVSTAEVPPAVLGVSQLEAIYIDEAGYRTMFRAAGFEDSPFLRFLERVDRWEGSAWKRRVYRATAR